MTALSQSLGAWVVAPTPRRCGRDPICAVCGGGGSSRRRAGDRAFSRFFSAVSRISPGVPKLPDLVVTATEKADPPGVML